MVEWSDMLLKEISGLTYLTLCQANEGTMKLEDLLVAVKAKAKDYDPNPIYDEDIEKALSLLVQEGIVYEPQNGVLKVI